jgi:hypothetical protein
MRRTPCRAICTAYLLSMATTLYALSATAQSSMELGTAAPDRRAGGFVGRSGIAWAYKVETAGRDVRVTVRGDKDGKTYPAACSPTALSSDQTFETSCQYEGGTLGFKVRGRVDGDVVEALYLANNGDRASMSLFREAGAARSPTSSPSAHSGTAQSPTAPALPQPRIANLQLPTCKNFRFLTNYTRYSFVNRDDAILGISPTEWSTSTLAAVRRWADDCLAKGLPSEQVQSFQSLWQHFQKSTLPQGPFHI